MRFFKPNVPKLLAAKNVDGLVKAMSDYDVEIREAAIRALGELRFPRVVPPLITALKDKEWTVILTAIEALSQFGDARALEPLISLFHDAKPAVHKAAMENVAKFGAQAVPGVIRVLGSEDPLVRQNAAIVLGQLGDKKAVAPLCQALKDPEWKVREIAAQTLGQLGDKQAIDPLSDLLQDTNPQVVDAVAQALNKIGLPTDPVSRARYALAKNDFNTVINIGVPAVELLIGVLGNPNPDTRRNAARALGHIGDARAADPLLHLMRDEEWYVREAASWSIGRLIDPSIVPKLAALLKDNSLIVRESAAKALGQLATPDERVIPPLFEALKDDEYSVVEAAGASLSTMGVEVVRPLIEIYKEANSGTRRTIAATLEKIGVPDDPVLQGWFTIMQGDWARAIEMGDMAIEPLISALKDDDHRTRRAAAETLGNISQIGAVRAVEPLCQALRDRKIDVRKSIVEVLVKIGTPAVDPLIYTLNDTEWMARQSAATALGQIGDAWSVGPLCDTLQDPNPHVAEAAAEALDLLGLPEDHEVQGWYAVAKKDWSRAVSHGKYAVPALIQMMAHPDPDTRWSATRALGNIGDPRSVDVLRAALRDDESYVRDAAADALHTMNVPLDPDAKAATDDAAEGEAAAHAEVAETPPA